MSIRIFYDETNFRLKGSRKAVKIIEKIIGKQGKIPGEINFIITKDQYLRGINVQFLMHDYHTDVIAFDYCEGNIINGEVYISIETVKNNATNYKVSLRMEVLRVMIHGILHLAGYDDKTEMKKKAMKRVEDLWLGRFE